MAGWFEKDLGYEDDINFLNDAKPNPFASKVKDIFEEDEDDEVEEQQDNPSKLKPVEAFIPKQEPTIIEVELITDES